MVECSYCGQEFPDEERYLDHLEAAHLDELGRIDRRRIEQRRGDSTGGGLGAGAASPVLAGLGDRLAPLTDRLPQRLDLAIAVVLLGVLLLVLWSIDFGFAASSVHDHGYLIIEIDGERVDFDQSQYHEPDRFHFHPGNGEVWHMHPDRLTFEEAMDELGVPVTESSVTVDGTTYDDDDPETSVTMTINGEPPELGRDLQDGDQIVIVVETDV